MCTEHMSSTGDRLTITEYLTASAEQEARDEMEADAITTEPLRLWLCGVTGEDPYATCDPEGMRAWEQYAAKWLGSE